MYYYPYTQETNTITQINQGYICQPPENIMGFQNELNNRLLQLKRDQQTCGNTFRNCIASGIELVTCQQQQGACLSAATENYERRLAEAERRFNIRT